MDEQERLECLRRMRVASNAFYGAATQTGCHAFIEFTGLMNEFINACRDAHMRGEDFTQANVHSGKHLELAPHQHAYLNEKMACIYGLQLEKIPEGK